MALSNTLLPNGTRILLIRLSAIGDVLHATAIAHNLKHYYPNCHLTWLVSPPADCLLANNPDIDEILVWDRRPLDKAFTEHKPLAVLAQLKKARQLLKRYHFDLVIDIQCLFITGIIAKLSSTSRRIGIQDRHEGNFIFMTEVAPATTSLHKVHRYMTALQPLGIMPKDFIPGPVLNLTNNQLSYADAWLKHNKILLDHNHKLLMVNIRTTWPDKNWAPKNFGQVLNKLPPNIQILFSGSANDIPFIEEAQQVMTRPSAIAAGKTNLLESAALIKRADLLLTGDTGPLYIAEAVGTATLSLWGPTHPDIYGPLTAGHHFIISSHSCTACCKTHCPKHTNACMQAIEPASVAKKLKELLS